MYVTTRGGDLGECPGARPLIFTETVVCPYTFSETGPECDCVGDQTPPLPKKFLCPYWKFLDLLLADNLVQACNKSFLSKGLHLQASMQASACLSGADPEFFKRGGAQIKGLQNFGACGDRGYLRGMCPLRSEEKLQFSKSICTIWCILFAWGTHTKSGALSLQKKEGARKTKSS